MEASQIHMAPMGTITGTVMLTLTMLEDGEVMEDTEAAAGEAMTSTEAKVVLKEVLLVAVVKELEETLQEVVEDNEEEDEGGEEVEPEVVVLQDMSRLTNILPHHLTVAVFD